MDALAANLEAGAGGDEQDRTAAMGRFARVVQRAGEGAPPLLIAMDADLELLRWLVHHPDTAVRDAAITATGHLGLTSWLARDASAEVRQVVARSAPTTASVLRGLAADRDAGVREALATRGVALPDDVASTLADDSHWQVRFALAGRPGLPGTVVRLLAEDADRRVRARIGARPAVLSPGGLPRVTAAAEHSVAR